MKYYKLLSQDLKSHNNTSWKLNVPITITKEGNKMCSDQVLHCYNHPLLAVLFNPIHAEIQNPRLFEIEVDSIVNTDGLKFASKCQTLIKEIQLPEISLQQKIHFAINFAKLVCKAEKWNLWAENYLSGKDVSKESASAAWYAANDAANAASDAYAAASDANAAWYAASDAANAASDAYAAASDAYAAANAAYAAANAANANAAANAYAAYAASAAHAASAAAWTAAHAAAYAASAITAADKNEFNQKMIDIIERIVRVKE